MESWFSGLPWQIRWAFIIGGSMVSNFSDRLPEAYQDAGLYLGLAIVAYGFCSTITHELKGRGFNLLPSLLISGGVFLIFAGVMLHVVSPPDSATPAVAQMNEPQSKPPKTLRFGKGHDVDLETLIVMFDFPNRVAIQSELVQPSNLVKSSYATFVTTQDLGERVAHNVIIIPKAALAENVALHICRNMDSLRDLQTSSAKIKRKYGEQRKIAGERLPYSDKIYIYHEPPLDNAARERVWNVFHERGYLVEFRGPERISKLRADHGSRKG